MTSSTPRDRSGGAPTSPSPGIAAPTLDDGAVKVRAMRASDLDDVLRHGAEAEMRRWTRVPVPYTRRDAEEFLAHTSEGWRRGTGYGFAVELDGAWAGSLDLRPCGLGLGEIGFGLAAWARGRSVMSRAVRLVLGWAFDQLGYEAVRWRAQVGNWPSRRLAWATGFRHEGTVTALVEQRGHRSDGWIATLRRGDPMLPLTPWWEPVRLSGPGVVLRGHEEDDAPRIVEACQDPDSQRWLSTMPAPYETRHALEHMAHVREQAATGQAVSWAVADPSSGWMLGEVMVFARDDARTHGEIGYWVHPDARGRGVVTEAARLAVRHALLPAEDGGLGMDRMLLRATEGNVASQRTALRLNFTRTGVDRNGNRLRDGHFADDVRYDLLAGELPAARD